jgi:hypothetical protein
MVFCSIVLSACGNLNKLSELADKVQTEETQASFEPTDETDIVGDVEFPPESQRAGWVFEDHGDVADLTAYYEDVTLKQAMEFMGSFSDGGWYLTDHYAYNGSRDADIYYSLDTQSLEIVFTLVKGRPAWPKGTLTPYLQYLTTPYPYGTYAGSEADGLGKAFSLTYEDTSFAELMNYLDRLQVMGYTTDDGKTLMGNVNYVSYSYDYEKKTATITVGMRDIQMVPLPPWPEPLPEHLVRLLPPVGGVIEVTGAEDGFFASAKDLSLSELYGFVSTAPRYGWSELAGQDEITHADTGFALRFLSYDSRSNGMTLTIWNTQGGQPMTAGPEESAQPSRTEQPSQPGQSVQTEGGYKYALTQGKYGEQQVEAGILAEFGQGAELADFSEIKALFTSDIRAFLDRAGVQAHEDVWVQYDGDAYFGGQRHYFMERVSGAGSEGFLIHDRVGDEVWLGSWYGMQIRALVKVPNQSD